jgi:hypothetical protein
VPSQHPSGQLFEVHWQLPATHCWPEPQTAPAPHAQPPSAPHRSDTLEAQVVHWPPPAPQRGKVEVSQLLPLQQPVEQLSALHTHSAASHRWPCAHTPASPQAHWPARHASARASHALHTPPSAPQKARPGA